MLRRIVIVLIALAFALAATLGLASVLLGHSVGAMLRSLDERTPGELVRYAERRLEGHPRLETLARPFLRLVRERSERPVAQSSLPSFGKGAQVRRLAAVRYDADGRPEPATEVSAAQPAEAGPDISVDSAAGLARAIDEARPGQVVDLRPGRYRIARGLQTRFAGTPQAPIVVRAEHLGAVVIEVDSVEGFVVSRPYWVFENLVVRGVCRRHDDCEHAFHVVGKARGTVLRNNRIEDFNAQLKINGAGGDWPDDGLVQFNTLIDTVPRATDQPVAPIDLVAASRWQVLDNIVADFVKAEGDRISYGMFMKGAGGGGRIERNLVICTRIGISRPGVRVGLSFGDGGTGAAFCRDRHCAAEHFDGRAVDNVVAHCNDFGIDVYRSARILIAHNTLVNTAGIDLRDWSSAHVHANLLDGRIRARDGAEVTREDNEVRSLPALLEAPDALQLAWRAAPEPIAALPGVTSDFCGRPRGAMTLAGALDAHGDCADAAQPSAR
jgi:hypothetical protein